MKAIFLTATLLLSLSSFGEDKAPSKEEMMKAMKEYSTPGENHNRLAELAGSWTYTSKWWDSAEAKPQDSKGTSTMKMVLGGRYLQHETKGKAMGMPFEGLGITGYDNLKKIYQTVWLDSMATGIMHGEGQFDAATSTLTDKGEFTNPMKKDLKGVYRSEWKIVDKNNTNFTLYGTGMGDKEFKMMEIVYKRKK